MLHIKNVSLVTVIFALIISAGFSTTFAQSDNTEKANQNDQYTLEVEVMNAESGEAIADAKIEVFGKELNNKTGENGLTTFEEFPGGAHIVTVEVEGYEKWKKKVTVTEDSKLTVELQPTG